MLSEVQTFTSDRGEARSGADRRRAAVRPDLALRRDRRDRADGRRARRSRAARAAAAQRGRRDHRRHRHAQPADADEVSAIASGIDVPVYIIAVVVGSGRPAGEHEDQRRRLRPRICRSSRAAPAASCSSRARRPTRASRRARSSSELRHQYVLAFEASARAGWRPLEVRTRKDSLTVRARSGYSGGESIVGHGARSRRCVSQRTSQRPDAFRTFIRRRQ